MSNIALWAFNVFNLRVDSHYLFQYFCSILTVSDNPELNTTLLSMRLFDRQPGRNAVVDVRRL